MDLINISIFLVGILLGLVPSITKYFSQKKKSKRNFIIKGVKKSKRKGVN